MWPRSSPTASSSAKARPWPSALDADGKPTKALEGFMRSAGVALSSSCERVADGKAEYFVAQRRAEGQGAGRIPARDRRAGAEEAADPKLMRWGDSDALSSCARCMVWSCCTATASSPAEVLGLTSGNVTQRPPLPGQRADTLNRTRDDYEATLARDGRVIASFAKRRESIAARLDQRRETEAIWMACQLDLEKLLSMSNEERSVLATAAGRSDRAGRMAGGVCRRVRARIPRSAAGMPDPDHAAEPEIFPAAGCRTGKLLNKFLIVSNMQVDDPQHIIDGNQRVVRPRLSDARFFFNQDRKQRLESRVAKLGNVVYHNKLGTQLQRVERITTLAGKLRACSMRTRRRPNWPRACARPTCSPTWWASSPNCRASWAATTRCTTAKTREVAEAIEATTIRASPATRCRRARSPAAVALADKLETLVGHLRHRPGADRRQGSVRLAPPGAGRPAHPDRNAAGAVAARAAQGDARTTSRPGC